MLIAVILHVFLLVYGFRVSYTTVVKYIVYNLFSIYLPGLALTSCLKMRLEGISCILIPYSLGYACLVFEYFASEMSDRIIPFWLFNIVIIFVSLFIVVRNCSLFDEDNFSNDIEGFLVFLLVFIINIFSYSANNLGVEAAPEFTTGRAIQYWANNSVALKLSWPTDNLFFVGDRLNYHYFSSIPIAFLSDVYKISIFDLSFPLYSFTKSAILAGAVLYMFEAVGAEKRIKYVGTVVLLCTAGLDCITHITFSSGLYRTPFGFDIGFAYGMMFLTQIYKQVKENELRVSYLIISFFFWIMCVGGKAPISTVIILAPGLQCFVWLIKRNYKCALIYGIMILVSFIIICHFCIGLFNVTSGNAAWALRLHTFDEICDLGYSEDWDRMSIYLAKMFADRPVIGLLIKLLFINPIMELIFLVSCICFFASKKNKEIDDEMQTFNIICILVVIIGIIMGMVVDAENSSEKYFVMATFIPGSLLCIEMTSRYFHKSNMNAVLYTLVKYIGVMVLLFCVVRFTWTERYASEAKSVLVGMRNMYYSEYSPEKLRYDRQTVRRDDVRALQWIRDNTSRDIVVLSDRAVMTNDEDYYLYGLFSERQQYVEGTGMLGNHRENIKKEIESRKQFVKMIYSGEVFPIEEVRARNISYIVHTKDISPSFKPDDIFLEQVYETETMAVFAVR